MLNIGCHLSLSKGYEAMGEDALSINANTFQFFTRNPRGGTARDIEPADANALAALMEHNRFAPILAHASYTMNLCSANELTRAFAQNIMADDLQRLTTLPCTLYNFHPGSHTGQGVETGIYSVEDGVGGEVVREEYFDLSGRRIVPGSETKGLVLRRSYLSDGTVKVDKLMKE